MKFLISVENMNFLEILWILVFLWFLYFSRQSRLRISDIPKELLVFLRSADFRKNHDSHTKNGNQQGIINFHILRILLEKLNFAENGPKGTQKP